MSQKVLITDTLAPQGLDQLRACADLEVEVRLGLAEAELIRVIPPYHGLIIRSGTRVTRKVIAAAANLRVIGRAGIGVDNIDVEYAKEKGIPTYNTPASSSNSVAELVFGHPSVAVNAEHVSDLGKEEEVVGVGPADAKHGVKARP